MTRKGEQTFTDFDGSHPPEDFEFPSIELEDIDRAVFDLFDHQIRFEVEDNGKSKKIPVIFSTGERFALTRRKDPIRDNNNALILPLISIQRGTIDTSSGQHGKGTPIAFGDQPGYYIKRKLSKKDRQYQNIINKLGIKNQDNVASKKNFGSNEISPGNTSIPGGVASRRNGPGNGYFQKNISLEDNLEDNIYEIIEVPYPKFTCVQYEVTFWCQYMTQMNQVMQNLFINYKGQGHELPIKTRDGYEMMAFFSDNIVLDSNMSNFSSDERMIKYKTQVTVNGYVINPKSVKGVQNLMRAYLSAPKIEFGYKENHKDSFIVENNQEDSKKFILSDIKNIKDLKDKRRGEGSETIQHIVKNPFTNEKEIKFSKVIEKNTRAGESVISPLLIKKIDSQYE
tara:strand:- start:2256 stop:3446 length:1191 start_codon:yes stop_codon:yes gene_type:complete